jgi:hypothetical protein
MAAETRRLGQLPNDDTRACAEAGGLIGKIGTVVSGIVLRVPHRVRGGISAVRSAGEIRGTQRA